MVCAVKRAIAQGREKKGKARPRDWEPGFNLWFVRKEGDSPAARVNKQTLMAGTGELGNAVLRAVKRVTAQGR